ncbi:MAG: hypothetical protein PHC51_00165 [bacterium]|nr:hypothetical protein [bacterium]
MRTETFARDKSPEYALMLCLLAGLFDEGSEDKFSQHLGQKVTAEIEAQRLGVEDCADGDCLKAQHRLDVFGRYYNYYMDQLEALEGDHRKVIKVTMNILAMNIQPKVKPEIRELLESKLPELDSPMPSEQEGRNFEVILHALEALAAT